MSIRVAIVGAGNCAKSLVEGIEFYRQNSSDSRGLMHPTIGGFEVADIEIVAAFDVDRRKVGLPLDEALVAEPNRTLRLAELPSHPVRVQRGPTLDGVTAEASSYYIQESPMEPVDVVRALRSSGTEIVLNYLPTGSNRAASWYSDSALIARCSFVNCMPTPLAKDDCLYDRFVAAGLALLGDDIKSQFGATVINRALLELMKLRGVCVTDSSQVNHGGNADHFNLRFRHEQKAQCKLAALRSIIGSLDLHPSVRMEYVESQYDSKRAVITLRGESFGRAPVSVEIVLQDEDSPNSAGVVVDCIRVARLLVDAGECYRARDVCASLMKSPSQQMGEGAGASQFESVVAEVLGRGAQRLISTPLTKR